MTEYVRGARNLTVVNGLIARFMVEGYLNKLRIKDPHMWRRASIELNTKVSRILLDKMDFDVKFTYSRPDLFDNDKRYFMVCNHMSYMDMAFLSVVRPTVFVTSIEMKNTPFLGDIASFGGSYFVERRDRTKVPGEVRELAQLMRDGFDVFVFPEGTSSHGMYVLPFKRALFTAAIQAEVEVLPICLRYELIDGQPFSEENKDRLCWHGDMGFLPHFLQVMTLQTLQVSVNYLEPISTKEFPDRHLLADQAYAQITKSYFMNRDPSFKPWPFPPEVEARAKKFAKG
jgi:1-acyl-sn-glycerol-3-phosphate acyltransferase